MPIFRWIYPKIMGKGQFFGALRAHKMLILLNLGAPSKKKTAYLVTTCKLGLAPSLLRPIMTT